MSPSALLDIKEIIDFADEKNPGSGQAYLDYLKTKAKNLSNFPLRGTLAKIRGYGQLHTFVAGNYKFYYICDEPNVEIVAVLHTRRKFSKAWKSRPR